MKIITTIVILLLVFSIVLVSFPEVRIVKAENTIYIRADGSVEGTDKIQREGIFYTFIDNINGSIIVEKDNVVVDGAGFTLQGPGSGTGISLSRKTNVTIEDMKIQYFSIGIALAGSSYNTISGNNLKYNEYQASIFVSDNSSDNKINNNNIEANEVNGIWLHSSSNNIISANNIKANGFEGIIVSGGSNNGISGNVIENNDGDGVYLTADSSRNTITENNITKSRSNAILIGSSSDNMILKNYLENNFRGIFLDYSVNNTIVRNSIKGNGKAGIEAITTSQSNTRIYHNNFSNNTKQVISTDSIDIWDNDQKGNYWNDYNGTDNDGNGIGDTPYIIDDNNQDNYPLIEPVMIPEFPSWTLFPLFLTVTLIGFVVRKRLVRTRTSAS